MSTEKKLAERIKSLRAEAGFTQNQLAEVSGIEYKHIQALESVNNKHSPTLRTLEKLCDAFDLELWEFLKPLSK